MFKQMNRARAVIEILLYYRTNVDRQVKMKHLSFNLKKLDFRAEKCFCIYNKQICTYITHIIGNPYTSLVQVGKVLAGSAVFIIPMEMGK